ncbi:MAG: hypothetical protein V4671_00835, partial [Armatimonadota bacterium]
TIGELVKRTSAACGIELHTDYRFAALPARVQGGEVAQVSAGDLVQALSRAVGGAWRRVDNGVYVLAGDRMGEGALCEKQIQWLASEERRNTKIREQWQAKIRREGNFRRFIGFAAENSFAPDAALAVKISEAESRAGYPNRETAIPIEDLTPALAVYWKQRIAQINLPYLNASSMTLIRVNTVRFILPDGAALSADYTLSDIWTGIVNLPLFEKEREKRIVSAPPSRGSGRPSVKPTAGHSALLPVPKLSSLFLRAGTVG